MFDYTFDQENRFNPNKAIGDEFENQFEKMTKGMKGISKAKDPMSVFDFQFYHSRLELKSRRYLFDTFPSWAITVKKFDALIKYKSALYFNRFSDGSIYVVNLKTINSPLETSTYTSDTGYTVKNYLLPSNLFIHLPDENSVREYLRAENQRVYQEVTIANQS